MRQRTDQIDVFTTETSCVAIVWATIQDIRLHPHLSVTLLFADVCSSESNQPERVVREEEFFLPKPVAQRQWQDSLLLV